MNCIEARELDLSEGRLWLEELGLGLAIWQGSYKQVSGSWLRFYDAALDWIPTPMEEADRFRQLLIENGIDPDRA